MSNSSSPWGGILSAFIFSLDDECQVTVSLQRRSRSLKERDSLCDTTDYKRVHSARDHHVNKNLPQRFPSSLVTLFMAPKDDGSKDHGPSSHLNVYDHTESAALFQRSIRSPSRRSTSSSLRSPSSGVLSSSRLSSSGWRSTHFGRSSYTAWALGNEACSAVCHVYPFTDRRRC